MKPCIITPKIFDFTTSEKGFQWYNLWTIYGWRGHGQSFSPVHDASIFILLQDDPETKVPYICAPLSGTIAQLVEQRIENPCVPGSNPGGTTFQEAASQRLFCCTFVQHELST